MLVSRSELYVDQSITSPSSFRRNTTSRSDVVFADHIYDAKKLPDCKQMMKYSPTGLQAPTTSLQQCSTAKAWAKMKGTTKRANFICMLSAFERIDLEFGCEICKLKKTNNKTSRRKLVSTMKLQKYSTIGFFMQSITYQKVVGRWTKKLVSPLHTLAQKVRRIVVL